MTVETFESIKNEDLYKYSARPFIDKLLFLKVPLSAITTNDWHCNTMPRVYVTREFGRTNGGVSQKVHLMQFGRKSANRLAKFYHN